MFEIWLNFVSHSDDLFWAVIFEIFPLCRAKGMYWGEREGGGAAHFQVHLTSPLCKFSSSSSTHFQNFPKFLPTSAYVPFPYLYFLHLFTFEILSQVLNFTYYNIVLFLFSQIRERPGLGRVLPAEQLHGLAGGGVPRGGLRRPGRKPGGPGRPLRARTGGRRRRLLARPTGLQRAADKHPGGGRRAPGDFYFRALQISIFPTNSEVKKICRYLFYMQRRRKIPVFSFLSACAIFGRKFPPP